MGINILMRKAEKFRLRWPEFLFMVNAVTIHVQIKGLVLIWDVLNFF